MIDKMFQDGTDKVLDHMARNPLPPRKELPYSPDWEATVVEVKQFTSEHPFVSAAGLLLLIVLVVLRKRLLRQWTKQR